MSKCVFTGLPVPPAEFSGSDTSPASMDLGAGAIEIIVVYRERDADHMRIQQAAQIEASMLDQQLEGVFADAAEKDAFIQGKVLAQYHGPLSEREAYNDVEERRQVHPGAPAKMLLRLSKILKSPLLRQLAERNHAVEKQIAADAAPAAEGSAPAVAPE